jgi:Animal haem peroxidase
MMAARSANAPASRAAETDRPADASGIDTAPGFRHFLGSPQQSQRFRVFGIDPLESPAHLTEIRALMNRLSRRMDAEIRWPSRQGSALEHWENPSIPSGYTYLLQFIAHDLVHSAIPLSISGKLDSGIANARRAPLQLESLYGSGPVGLPHVYALDAPNDDRRTKLRLGRMRWKEAKGNAGCPFRDIARSAAENVTGIDRSISGMRTALTEALIADPRNDDHAIISQLTALFATLHNGLIDIIRRRERSDPAHGRFGAAYKRFLCARDGLTSIYHHIIRNDVMRRVIHPAIYAVYSGSSPSFMDESIVSGADWKIPFEFSHGAFRFGHAMVRPEYRINELSTHDLNNTLEKTSANDPVNMPLDETWMVQWSRFFEINGSKPNYSRRIGPYLSDGLGHDEIFSSFDETGRVGLLYRDLLGSALTGMWSVDALITEIAARRPDLIGLSRLLSDRAYRTSQLRDWLMCAPSYGGLTTQDIETISNDPPLPFFILFEAMRQPLSEGLHLGPLGSIIVAEVVFGALARARHVLGHGSGLLAAQLAEISGNHYATNAFADIPDIDCMAQLVEFTADIAGLQEAVPAFL